MVSKVDELMAKCAYRPIPTRLRIECVWGGSAIPTPPVGHGACVRLPQGKHTRGESPDVSPNTPGKTSTPTGVGGATRAVWRRRVTSSRSMYRSSIRRRAAWDRNTWFVSTLTSLWCSELGYMELDLDAAYILSKLGATECIMWDCVAKNALLSALKTRPT